MREGVSEGVSESESERERARGREGERARGREGERARGREGRGRWGETPKRPVYCMENERAALTLLATPASSPLARSLALEVYVTFERQSCS